MLSSSIFQDEFETLHGQIMVGHWRLYPYACLVAKAVTMEPYLYIYICSVG